MREREIKKRDEKKENEKKKMIRNIKEMLCIIRKQRKVKFIAKKINKKKVKEGSGSGKASQSL